MPLVSGSYQNYQNVAVSNQLMNVWGGRECVNLEVTVNFLGELCESVDM